MDYPPPSLPVIGIDFNTGLFQSLSSSITIAEADRRYVRLGGIANLSNLFSSSGTITNLISTNINAISYSLNGNAISLDVISSITNGVGQADKALVLDTVRDIRNIRRISLGSNTTAGAMDLNVSNTNANCAIRMGSAYTANNAITLQWNYVGAGSTSNNLSFDVFGGSNQLVLTAGGNIGININNPSERLHLNNGNMFISNTSTAPQLEIGRSQTNGNAFYIGYTHIGDGNVLNRLFIQPRGASVNDTLTYTVNGGRVGIGSPTPTQKLEVNGNINVSSGNGYMIGGNNIDDRYLRTTADTTSTAVVRFYASQAAGAADQTIIRFGHTTASGDWFIRHHRSSGGDVNNCLELLNTNSNLIGYSIGTGNGSSVGDGCMLVINGIQGDGGAGFIKASSVNCNGSLHLNSGIPQSVPANRRYGSSTSDPSNQSGGTVAISLYTYNDIWVRGNMYATSDRRAKKDIKRAVDIQAECMNLLKEEIEPVWYKWKDTEDGIDNLGYIAQNLVLNGITGLIQEFKNDSVKEECLETNTPAGRQLVVDYSKLSIYLVEICKGLNARLKKLEQIIEEYDIIDA